MQQLDLEQLITLDDGNAYQFVARAGAVIKLQHVMTRQTTEITLAELARRSTTSVSPLPEVGYELDRLPTDQTDIASVWAGHIEELITGKHPNLDEPRPQYALTRSLNNRIETKIQDLKVEGIKGASRANIFRKRSAYLANGQEGLIDGHSTRVFDPLAHLSPDVRDALEYVLATTTKRSTGTIQRSITETRAELTRRFGPDAPPMPHQSTMYRYIGIIDNGKSRKTAHSRQTNALRPDRTYRSTNPTLPGEEVQVDSTVLDVMIKNAKGKGVRPTLTVMMDVKTRSIIAYTFRLVAAKGVDHVALLIQAMTPRENRPDRSLIRAEVANDYPEIHFLSAAERAILENRLPLVRPKRIHMDNGKDFRSRVFSSAARQLEIDLTRSPKHTPTGKPEVERFFRTDNDLWAQYLPGHVGRSPEHRGAQSAKDTLLTFDALVELFDDWLIGTYQNRPHSALRDPRNRSMSVSPNQMFSLASEVTRHVDVPFTQAQYIGMLESVRRIIGRDGINYKKNVYDSVLLHPFRETSSPSRRHNGLWEIKVDPYNPDYVFVRGTDDQWILARRKTKVDLLAPSFEAVIADEEEALAERAKVASEQSRRQGVPLHDSPFDLEPAADPEPTEPAPIMGRYDPEEYA